MKTIFLISFAVAALVHFTAILTEKELLRILTKACLMPLVLAVYLSGTDRIFIPVILALLFGWAGDLLLVKIADVRFLRLGLASFLVGHGFYIAALVYCTPAFNTIALFLSIPAALALGIGVYRLIRPVPEMKIPVMAYETVLLLMAASALQLFLARGAPFGTFVFAGSLCFLVSDTILALFTFRSMPRYGNFPVMLSYTAAQLCIILGFSGIV